MQITHQTNGDGLLPYPSKVEVHDVNVYMHDSGMMGVHDYSCPCCRNNHAILTLDNGLMNPCNDCESKGYKLIKVKESFFSRIINYFK